MKDRDLKRKILVKNLVQLHDGKIEASNRLDKQGALIEIQFPSL